MRQLSRRYRSIQADVKPILDDLQAGNTPGDKISGSRYTLFKTRIKNSDNHKGKSGGYRMIYYIKTETHITLVTLYSKSDQGDINSDELRRILRDYEDSLS